MLAYLIKCPTTDTLVPTGVAVSSTGPSRSTLLHCPACDANHVWDATTAQVGVTDRGAAFSLPTGQQFMTAAQRGRVIMAAVDALSTHKDPAFVFRVHEIPVASDFHSVTDWDREAREILRQVPDTTLIPFISDVLEQDSDFTALINSLSDALATANDEERVALAKATVSQLQLARGFIETIVQDLRGMADRQEGDVQEIEKDILLAEHSVAPALELAAATIDTYCTSTTIESLRAAEKTLRIGAKQLKQALDAMANPKLHAAVQTALMSIDLLTRMFK